MNWIGLRYILWWQITLLARNNTGVHEIVQGHTLQSVQEIIFKPSVRCLACLTKPGWQLVWLLHQNLMSHDGFRRLKFESPPLWLGLETSHILQAFRVKTLSCYYKYVFITSSSKYDLALMLLCCVFSSNFTKEI